MGFRRKKSMNVWTPKKIRDLRNAYDESQTEFSRRMGVTVTTIANWEQGNGQPTGSAQKLLDRLEEDLAGAK
jgi:DNA-binding transcriptional regulator YiaG